MKIVPLIIAGGRGTRLFPLSTQVCPKQFMEDIYDTTLFEKSLELVSNKDIFTKPIVVTHVDYKNNVESLSKKDSIVLLLEDDYKNTLPAIYYGSKVAEELYGKDAVCITIFSDHLIDDKQEFESSCLEALAIYNKTKKVVLFGVRPIYSSISYGYFKIENSKITEFIEKPDTESAKIFTASKQYLWNTGISLITNEHITCSYDCFNLEFSFNDRIKDNSIYYFYTSNLIESKSISRGLFESIKDGRYVILKTSFTDVGNFKSLYYDFQQKTKKDLIVLGNNIKVKECKNSLIISKTDRPIEILGVDNIVVIETKDGLLIANKDSSYTF